MITVQRKQKYIGLIGGLIILVCVAGLVYGRKITSLMWQWETGSICIEVEEYGQTDPQEQTVKKEEGRLPGDALPGGIRIHNRGEACYVRARMLLREGSESEWTTDSEWIEIDSTSDWMLAEDGYYYYEKPLLTGETVDWYRSANISSHLPQKETEENGYDIKMEIEAIQETNFTPQWENTQPWGNLNILKSKKTEQGEIRCCISAEVPEICFRYDKDGEQWKIEGRTLPYKSRVWMPGDLQRAVIRVINETSEQHDLYLWRGEADRNGTEEIGVRIAVGSETGAEVLYEGMLGDPLLEKPLFLAAIAPESEVIWQVQLKIPETWDNSYVNREFRSQWNVAEGETVRPSVPTVSEDIPATGDKTCVETLPGTVLLAGMVMIITARQRRCRKESDNE